MKKLTDVSLPSRLSKSFDPKVFCLSVLMFVHLQDLDQFDLAVLMLHVDRSEGSVQPNDDVRYTAQLLVNELAQKSFVTLQYYCFKQYLSSTVVPFNLGARPCSPCSQPESSELLVQLHRLG